MIWQASSDFEQYLLDAFSAWPQTISKMDFSRCRGAERNSFGSLFGSYFESRVVAGPRCHAGYPPPPHFPCSSWTASSIDWTWASADHCQKTFSPQHLVVVVVVDAAAAGCFDPHDLFSDFVLTGLCHHVDLPLPTRVFPHPPSFPTTRTGQIVFCPRVRGLRGLPECATVEFDQRPHEPGGVRQQFDTARRTRHPEALRPR